MVFIIFVIALFVFNGRFLESPPTVSSPNPTNFSVAPQAAPVSSENPASKSDGQSGIGRVFEMIIGASGVSQNNLTVKTGDTVLFKNTDLILHWPASGPHPTHLGCPGFDSRRGLKQGESFSFTFMKTTVCSFHDHLNAGNSNYNGTITVKE